MLPFITLDGLAFRARDGRTLFEDLTLAFGGERTGLVGANGCGKTTLLRLILGELAPAAGAVTTRGRIGFLRQSLAPPPGASLADLLGASEDLARLDRIDRGEGTEADLADADWSLPARLGAALAEVGLAAFDPSRSAASLSGGEATRARLAGLLIARPDMILLDEPTNNLDAEARSAVRRVLAGWSGGALVVTHDRALLRAMDRIVEISGLGPRVYGSGYDLYAQRREEEAGAAQRDLENAAREAKRVEREVQATRERQDRRDAAGVRAKARGDQPRIVLGAMGARAEQTRGGQNRLADRKRADVQATLETARARTERLRKLEFALPSSGLAAGKLVLAIEDVAFAWPGSTPLMSGLNIRLLGPRRLAVTGANGAGKTTLMRLAAGELAPTEGRITRGAAAVMLDQRAALLRDDQSLMENYRRLNPAADDNAAHAALARFLFRNVSALKLAGDLSGGERLRAALACVLMAPRPPQLIVLDEPTNHLDLASIEAIESALAAYDGALLVVSHDEDFLAAVGVDATLRLAAPDDRPL
ncbi:MAG: transporter, ATP-binding protein [Caulobacteraceae bacterium]|nr:transporter, ATP-binding protein [Caulobacteraceae bacterium]